ADLDHFELAGLGRRAHSSTTVVAARHTADLLPSLRWREVHELGWGDRVRSGGLDIRGFEVNHWGARMRTDMHRGYNGYTIDAGRYRILFGGDTAATNLFRQVRTSRAYHLAIMPVGAYDPWIRYHCTPEQAWRMAQDRGGEGRGGGVWGLRAGASSDVGVEPRAGYRADRAIAGSGRFGGVGADSRHRPGNAGVTACGSAGGLAAGGKTAGATMLVLRFPE